ncbi:ATP-dependent helicase [Caldibacillus lycopersici]|uniref:DNA 3'-5' helicase n=1 Tax=Perspicuibacillus lycopersici TaxID=1325689 RepID=A0AAE3IUK9_9BACI|nr:ATP-dependent helicase [Perspicuibacillus lycopersici]MCU9614477.1 ATP-dependent helicase [Perspicuibacillus lycopersici]
MQELMISPFPKGINGKEVPVAEVIDSQVENELELADHYLQQLKKFKLNTAQLEAVQHYTGPLLTIAGAGSGKTTVLVCRTGYLINVHQVNPRNILLMTFTKKAADEMKQRLTHLPGMTKFKASSVQASTFHSFFLTILRSRGYQHKILSNDRFKQLIIKGILREQQKEDLLEAETLLDLFSSWKMNMVDITDREVRHSVGDEIIEVYKKYEQWKQRNNQMDFDDILVFSYQLVKEDEELLAALQNRFRFIMVDEFQDTNLLQYELIKLIAMANQNLMVVGDDDQTIYSFNGARNELILNFHKVFFNTKEVILNVNYRSHAAIVGLGNELIKHNKLRKEKKLFATNESNRNPMYTRPATVDEEAKWVVEQIKQKVHDGNFAYGDIAILYRAASNSRAIFEELMIADLPFIHYARGDLMFYDQWIVKPIIDYLRLSFNPKNMDAIEGVIPTLYIKKEVGLGFIQLNNQLQPKDYPLSHLTQLPSIKGFQIKTVNERMKLLETLNTMSPVKAIKTIRKDFYDKYIHGNQGSEITIGKETIKEMLDELETSAKRFATIAEFLTFIDEIKRKQQEVQNSKLEERNHIQLMTIHKAKGLEFPLLYLIGASEGILPHVTALEAGKVEKATKEEKQRFMEQALEEERRLAYVAVTRAKEELYISSPAYYRGKEASISRFFLEAYGVVSSNYRKETTEGTVHHYKGKQEKRKRTVLAWICTTTNCKAWQRITSEEELVEDERECPLCKEKMAKGEKVIYE